jgi:phage tail sheath protein FI
VSKIKAARTTYVDAQAKLKALEEAKAKEPPVQADIDAAKTAYDAAVSAYGTAQKDLKDKATLAEKKLADALAAKPPVPSDIATAEAELKAAEDAMKGADSSALDQGAFEGSKNDKTGLFALDRADLFNLLCIPPDTRDGDVPAAVYQAAMTYCAERRAMLLVDSPGAWSRNTATAAADAKNGLADLGLSGNAARNAALYFPRLRVADPLRDGQVDTFVPCGAVAGIIARTDTARGVWKAPAGLEAAVNGVQGFTVALNDPENGMLNPLGINCLRAFPVNGRVVWGARTLRGADQLADEYKYVPVRRTALFIEESLYRGTQWVVFEPNDEPLWAQIRLNVGAFMHGLFRQGAFQGQTPRDAYFVKCDKETTTQDDINRGIVNIVVGFAPLKPAEFVVFKLQQIAGQIPA